MTKKNTAVKTAAPAPKSSKVSRQIRWVAPADIAFNPENARTHSPEQLETLGGLIERYDFTQPVLVDEAGMLIAGEGRIRAAIAKGLAKVPVLDAIGWSAEQKRAYALADNKVALMSGWDDDVLRSQLRSLGETGLDLASIGFSRDELAAIMNPARTGLTDPEHAPPAPIDPVSALGDLWLLGPHRVLCGDATIAENVDQLLSSGVEVPNLMVTDPPYGVEYDPGWRARAGVGSGNSAQGAVLNDDRCDWRAAWSLFPGNIAYVWHGGLHGSEVQDSLEAVKFDVRAQIIWVKTRPALSRGHYHWQHEPAYYAVRQGADDDQWRFLEDHEAALYAVRAGKTGDWHGGRKQSTCWFIENLRNNTGHGTQKPIEAMKRPIENNSQPGSVVYDPFLGSGTTLMAATMSGRICIGFELNPAYVDVIVRRWEAFTGEVATTAGGETLEQLAVKRKKAA